MNVSEDHDDEIERLYTHLELLPPAEELEKLLQENRVVFVNALTPRVVLCDTKAVMKSIIPQGALHDTVAQTKGTRPRVVPKNSHFCTQ